MDIITALIAGVLIGMNIGIVIADSILDDDNKKGGVA